MYTSMHYHIDFESLAQRMIKDQSSFAHHLGELYIVSDSKRSESTRLNSSHLV